MFLLGIKVVRNILRAFWISFSYPFSLIFQQIYCSNKRFVSIYFLWKGWLYCKYRAQQHFVTVHYYLALQEDVKHWNSPALSSFCKFWIGGCIALFINLMYIPLFLVPINVIGISGHSSFFPFFMESRTSIISVLEM